MTVPPPEGRQQASARGAETPRPALGQPESGGPREPAGEEPAPDAGRPAAGPAGQEPAPDAGHQAAEPAAVYGERRERFAAEEGRLGAISLRLSIARGVVFAAFAGCLLWLLLSGGRAGPPALWGAGAALAVFVALAVVHELRLRVLRRVSALRTLNDEGLARLERDWDRLPLPAEPPRDRALPLARDLDLYGRASLFQLLGTAHTPAAKALLRQWIESGAPPAEIAPRQAAVAELAPLADFRQRLELATRGMEAHPPDCEPFLRWAEGEPWLLARPALLWTARALGLAATVAAAGALALVWPPAPALLLMTANFTLSYLVQGPIGRGLGQVSASSDEIMRTAAAMRHLAGQPLHSPRLRAAQAALAADAAGEGGPAAHAALAVLEGRIGLADARHSAPLHFVLQVLTLWDLHVLALLERWQATAGRRARRWLGALGEVEALSALAVLRFENPGWVMPRVAAGEPALQAEGLGHPLLPPGQRIGNDVTVGPAGTFLLVTGSNMSGKSTLLRAIGLNVLLAQAGGPACAAALRLPPVVVATSVLVEDSLAGGVSFFLAELLRIREVVAAADTAERAGVTLLYLLDEVLRGTNSAERQVAVRRVLRHLLARGALGAVSTHDLELAAGAGAPDIAAAARTVHFAESLAAAPEGPRMTFDYRLRPGPATTTNALLLLRQVGLDLPGE